VRINGKVWDAAADNGISRRDRQSKGWTADKRRRTKDGPGHKTEEEKKEKPVLFPLFIMILLDGGPSDLV
jgi:hypothetical protein